MNMKLFSCLFTAAYLFGTTAFGQEVSPAQRGEQTYMRVGCFQCHGTNGQGSDAGTALTPDPLPAEAIANFIRFSPGRMPVYPEEVLSDEEIADIVAYLGSVPLPPDPDTISVLKDLNAGG